MSVLVRSCLVCVGPSYTDFASPMSLEFFQKTKLKKWWSPNSKDTHSFKTEMQKATEKLKYSVNCYCCKGCGPQGVLGSGSCILSKEMSKSWEVDKQSRGLLKDKETTVGQQSGRSCNKLQSCKELRSSSRPSLHNGIFFPWAVLFLPISSMVDRGWMALWLTGVFETILLCYPCLSFFFPRKMYRGQQTARLIIC